MLKKLLLVFGLTAALSVAPLALAQMPATEAEALAAFAKEGPLTQKDLDALLTKVLPRSTELAGDREKAAAVFKEAGFTEVRGGYVFSKFFIGVMLMDLPADADAEALLTQRQVPDVLKPSKAEMELFRQNKEKIQKVFMGQ